MAIFGVTTSFANLQAQGDVNKSAMDQQQAYLQEALKRNQQQYAESQQMLQPYANYGLMGMERMLGTQPMQQTMGHNAQQYVRQQTPTLTERTDRHLGSKFTNEMTGNLLGEEGTVSVPDYLSGKRSSLGQEDAAKYLRQVAMNMLKGKENPKQTADRPSGGWKWRPQGRAKGGPVSAGQPYMVGEQGPEMIVPQQAGQVIPNMQGNMNMLGMGMNPGTQPRQRGGPRGQAFAQWAQQAHAAALAAGRGGPRSRGQMQPGQMGTGMPGQPQMAPGGPPPIVGPGGTNPALQQGQYMQPGMQQPGQMQRGMPQMQGQNLLASIQDRALASGRGGPRSRAAQMARGGPMRGMMGMQGIPGRAYGGPVQANNPYMVGETGPEVVVPGGGGKKSLSIQQIQQIQQAMKRKALGLPPQGQQQAAQPPPQQGQYMPQDGGLNLLPNPNNYSNPLDTPGYMLDPAPQDLMDWESIANQPPTDPQPGILEQGPPDAGPAPTQDPFDFSAYQESPWYQQGLDQGINAIERSAVGQGSLYSGAAGQALNQFGQDYAMSKYMPAREMYNQEGNNEYNKWLQSGQFGLNNWLQGSLYPGQEQMRLGQNMAQFQANMGMNNSQYQGNLLTNMGVNQAGGILGMGEPLNNFYNSMTDINQNSGSMLMGMI